MTTILVLHDDRSVDEHEFDADVRSVTIGRRPSNDICVHDRSVSGRHARLDVRDDGTWLEDLASTNGTWLDGEAVTQRRLEDGDEVLVGKVRLKVHVLDPWAEGASSSDRVARGDFDDGAADDAFDVPAGRPASAEARRSHDVPLPPLDEGTATPSRASGTRTVAPHDEDSFVERSLGTGAAGGDDDDDLDESMRRALALYGDDEDEDPVDAPAAIRPGFGTDDDEPDFAEDARLFAQPVPHGEHDSHESRESHEPRDGAGGDEPELERDLESARAGPADDPLSLSDRAKAALGRQQGARPVLRAVDSVPARDPARPARRDVPDRAGRSDDGRDGARAAAPVAVTADVPRVRSVVRPDAHRRGEARGDAGDARELTAANGAHSPREGAASRDGLGRSSRERRPVAPDEASPDPTHELDRTPSRSRGAVIQIKNGAKSGQILPIDKPVTTLGRPGIQIAAIMRKPDGYFLMHIESDDAVDRPTLNSDSIGDEPVLLHSGDELNVAGIDVEFMLS